MSPSDYRYTAKYTADAILVGAAAAGVGVALFNYFQPNNGIDGSWGALLVVASSALVLSASLVLTMFAKRVTPRMLLGGAIFLGLIGTAAAAYFLESAVLVAIMAVALVGWLVRISFAPNVTDLPIRSDRTMAQ